MKAYHPLSHSWSAEELFSGLNRHEIQDDDLINYKPFLMADYLVEADAENLYLELTRFHPISAEFKKFLDPWHQEELNHARGFKRILNILYDLDEETLNLAHQARSSDFSHLQTYLNDEFKLAVLLAYDEYCSTVAYRKDVFYQNLGPEAFKKWIQWVIKDEARHFMNAVKLIHCKHQKRIPETHDVLADILAQELKIENYQSTFLLHADSDYGSDQAAFSLIKTQSADKVAEVITRGFL